jgi:hypothetical protein
MKTADLEVNDSPDKKRRKKDGTDSEEQNTTQLLPDII